MVMGVSPRMEWGAAGVGVWASVSPGNLSRFPTLTRTHASSPVLPSFLHVPVPLSLPGLRSRRQVWHWDQNYSSWSHFILTRASKARLGGDDLPPLQLGTFELQGVVSKFTQ